MKARVLIEFFSQLVLINSFIPEFLQCRFVSEFGHVRCCKYVISQKPRTKWQTV